MTKRSVLHHCWPLLILLLLWACGGPEAPSDAADLEPQKPADDQQAAEPEPETETSPSTSRATLAVPDAQIEFHGRWRGALFWVRLYPRDAAIGGRRLMELSYVPPDQDETAGVVLADHPELLVDDVLRIFQWSEGGGSISGLEYVPGEQRYAVVHERERDEGDQRVPYETSVRMAGPLAWDLRLAPVLLAIIWQPQTASPAIPVRDFFGPRSDADLTLQWQDDRVRIGDQDYRIDADSEGRLATLRDHRGSIVLSVDGWRPVLDPAAAHQQVLERHRRQEAFLDRSPQADYIDLQDKLDTGRMEIIVPDESE